MTSGLTTRWRTLILAGLASAAFPVMAMNMPAEQHRGSVSFVTGGVGETEARQFQRQLTRHPLAIEVLEHAGKAEEFTADARVKITDRHGHTVLNAETGGPFMLVDLAPGRYSIEATLKGHTLKKSSIVVAHNKTARATFEFPAHTDG